MNKKNNSKILTFIIVIVSLVIGWIYLNHPNKENSTMEQVSDNQLQAIARVDVSSSPFTEDSVFFISKDGEEISEADWMKKFNQRGYVLQKEGNNTTFTINAQKDSDIKLVLRGPDKRDSNNNLIENWVDFTLLKINGEEILTEMTAVWHNKPFTYVIKAKTGETYNVEAKWQKHQD